MRTVFFFTLDWKSVFYHIFISYNWITKNMKRETVPWCQKPWMSHRLSEKWTDFHSEVQLWVRDTPSPGQLVPLPHWCTTTFAYGTERKNLKSSLRPRYIASDTKSEPKISVWTGLNLSWIYHFLFITTLYPQSLPNTSETDNRGPCCVTLAQFKLESLFKSPLQGTVVTGLSCSEPCSVW